MKNTLGKLALLSVLSLGALTLVEAQSTGRYQIQSTSIGSLLPETTHLGVDVGRLATIQTSQVYSGLPSEFYYDGFWNAPFSVPAGYVFVVTDVITDTIQNTNAPKAYGYMKVNGFLTYPIRHAGEGKTVETLSTGLVIRPGDVPKVYAYSSNTHTFEVTMSGYFVKGDARAPGTPFQG